MPTTNVEKSFCTTKEASLLLGVSVGTVQLWVENGLLQAWKTAGGHRRVLRDSVERLLHKSPSAPAATEPVQAARPLKILVVEDDLNLLRLYEIAMAAWPMAPHVITVDNAFTALLMMGRSAPDLLVTDLNMPGMDGFDMLKVLSHTPEMARTRIVAVTGLDTTDVKARGGLPESVEVLPKPVPFARLQTIAQAIAAQTPVGAA